MSGGDVDLEALLPFPPPFFMASGAAVRRASDLPLPRLPTCIKVHLSFAQLPAIKNLHGVLLFLAPEGELDLLDR